MATTSAQRQRKRRDVLRARGIVDVTVSVPESRKAELRGFARRLTLGQPVAAQGRLHAVITALKSIRTDLQQSGIRRAGVFGSAARGTDGPDSDVDIVVDLDAAAVGDILDFVRIAEGIEQAVQERCPGVVVDVADLASLKSEIRATVEAEAVYAF